MRLLFGLFDRLLMVALLAAVAVVLVTVVGRDTVEATATRLLQRIADAGAVPASVVGAHPTGDGVCFVYLAAIDAGGHEDYGLAARAGEAASISLAAARAEDGDAGEIGLSVIWPLGSGLSDYGRLVAVDELTLVLPASGGYTVRLDNAHDLEVAKSVELRLCIPA